MRSEYCRVLVVGVTGSGKTTMARAIADRLQLPHVEIDEHHWGPRWTPRSEEEFRARVASAIAGERWVACGNYHGKLNDLTWSTADMIVWLDYPRRITLTRLLMRTLRRVFSRQILWSGNRESIRQTFFSSDSLLVWWWKVSRAEPGRTESRVDAARPSELVRLRSPTEASRWLAGLS